MAARLVPRGRWSTGLSWGTKVLVPPDGVWRLRCSPLEMRKLRLRGSFWWGGWDPPKLSPGERTRTAGQLRSPSLGTRKGREAGAGLARGGGDWVGGAPQTPPPSAGAVRASPKSARPRWARRTCRHNPRAPQSPACPGVYGATPLRRPAGPTPRPEPAPRPGKGAVGPAGRGRREAGRRDPGTTGS